MNIKIYLYVILINIFYCISYDNNIYQLSSSTRNSALGDIKINADDVSSIFDAPLTIKNNNKEIYFSYNKEFDGLINVFHFGYNIYSNKRSNLGIGIAHRNIKNNTNTNDAWNDNGNNIPEFDEIDYSSIVNFSDQEIGLLISYNSFIENNSIIGFNIKPNYHTIGSHNALGLSFDLNFLNKINNNQIIFGLSDFVSVKKWNYGLKETFEPRIFLNYSYIDINALFSIEYDNFSILKIGFEYNINDMFSIQLGDNNSNLSLGFGFRTKYLIINYAYLDNSSIDFMHSHRLSFLFKINEK